MHREDKIDLKAWGDSIILGVKTLRIKDCVFAFHKIFNMIIQK